MLPPTDLRPSPAKRTIPQEVPNLSIYDKGPVGREDGISVPDRVMASIVHARGPLVL
jgi:hypothetical protein